MKQKVIKSGSSLVVVIRSAFGKSLGIKKGDVVEVKENKERGIINLIFRPSVQQLTLIEQKGARLASTSNASRGGQRARKPDSVSKPSFL